MAKILIIVTSASDHQASISAVKYAQAVLDSTHELLGVFFYNQAIDAANALRSSPSDEFDITNSWVAIGEQTRLIACSAAAQRRGVLNKEEADYHGHQQFNIAKGFEILGLGEFVQLQQSADKVIQF
ncbi:sulfurtransferase complex subunit TusD [Catenovulum sp. SM1970]|uniref:sulfurtransferase complex subunit TusD n=1 Tax=Marinifaba aquimaris TaxID=2741323 RepID=UPI001573E336|nr:sulfurtransferase complex subunit TusD [Marinifaba aquimaris]NTS75240.1 sulfurtransferase complex subunit TusD [Marinifaba aquimaris]